MEKGELSEIKLKCKDAFLNGQRQVKFGAAKASFLKLEAMHKSFASS